MFCVLSAISPLRSCSWVFLLCAALLWCCAAEKPPTGGLVDTEGPSLVQVSPPSGTGDLDLDQTIEVTFNERVDPVSVPGSVVFTPEVNFITRVRGRRVRIRPEEQFQVGRTYVLTLQRGIRDYQKNNLPRSYQLVFSTGGEIPIGRIQGRIAEADPQQPMEVGLFRPADPSADGFVHAQSMDLAADGSFSFDYLTDGSYRLAAVEGGLSDFPAALHRQPYALPTADSLQVKDDTITVAMHRSPPLAQPQMQSVEWLTPTYLAITFDTPFGDTPLPPNLYPTDDPATYGYLLPPGTSGQDTTVIDPGQGYTRLGEPYQLEPLAVPTPEIIDTMPPTPTLPRGQVVLESAITMDGRQPGPTPSLARYGEARGRITFSEPVRLPSTLKAHLTGKDSLGLGGPAGSPGQAVDLPLHQETPLSVVLDVPEPDRFDKITIPGQEITDEAGNPMSDSLVSFALVYHPPGATGSIRGLIVGISGRVVVETRDAATGRRTAHTVTDSAGPAGSVRQTDYVLDNVPPGFYTIFAHELVGARPVPYYSGRWEPYHRAARFSYYPEVVEVRPRWEVDGIDINFKVATLILPLDETAVKRE